jgi:hypothetical protein
MQVRELREFVLNLFERCTGVLHQVDECTGGGIFYLATPTDPAQCIWIIFNAGLIDSE